MLNGEPGSTKNIIELPESTHYQIFNQMGEYVDSGFAEFVDYSDFEPGRYFLHYDTVQTHFEKRPDIAEVVEIKATNNTLLFIIIITGALMIILLTYFIVVVSRTKNERERLLEQIEELKSSSVSNHGEVLAEASNTILDKEKVENAIDGKLNASDWKIAVKLVEQPSISNKELADQVALSVEGTRSSLKKMYRYFDIPTSRHMRLELVSQMIQISKSSS